ncbi:MAG: PilZ domain-containing protein [Candidatus Omnitrophota bacterium]|jgi:hypothetical protein
MADKRQISRWEINKPVKIQLEGAVVYAECFLKDINFKGLKIVLNLKLIVDSYIKFNLKLSDKCSLECEAWVAWHRAADGRNTYGLYFTRLKDDDKEKIYKFVYEHIPDEISKGWRGSPAKREKGEDMEDRRIFQRFNIRFPVRLLDSSSGQEITAETSDISAKGLGVWSKDTLNPRTPIEAWLKIPDRGEPLYTRGNVVWSKPEGRGEYHLGIDLERADLMGLSRILRA